MKTNNILIRNIFHMLSYAYNELNQPLYRKVSLESFDHMDNLFAKILQEGISRQIKRGLYREYSLKNEDASTLRGKLVFHGTINNRLRRSNSLNIEFDELTENNILNQTLKATMIILIRNPELDETIRIKLKRIQIYFSDIEDINLRVIKWDTILFNRQNHTYRLMINLSRFIVERHLINEDKGGVEALAFDDSNLSKIFERFVLEFYKKHYPKLMPSSPEIKWQIDRNQSIGLDFLPRMKSDIVLLGSDRDLIIDTKFYQSIYQSHYDTKKHHSSNLYQIYSYVMNYTKESAKDVTGLLLYAQTSQDIPPNGKYAFNGEYILVKSVDLNSDIDELEDSLKTLVEDILR